MDPHKVTTTRCYLAIRFLRHATSARDRIKMMRSFFPRPHYESTTAQLDSFTKLSDNSCRLRATRVMDLL